MRAGDPSFPTQDPTAFALPVLILFAIGVAPALYFFVFFDDARAGWIALGFGCAGIWAFVAERGDAADRALGPRLALAVGGELLAGKWEQQLLGTARASYLPPQWIVGREEPWGSVYVLRVRINRHARYTEMAVDVQGPDLPALSAERKRSGDSELIAPEEWNVTAGPGADEALVSRVVHLVHPLGVSAFQCEGTKLWCRARDPGPAWFGDNGADRLQALATLFQRAAEVGRELARLPK